MAEQTPGPRRIERILAYVVAAVVGLSILCFLALIIGTGVGLTGAELSTGPWPIIVALPAIGLPLGLLLLVALLIITAIRRGRESKDARG